jgi:alpha-beta hydrolase superfamily lysophospholipase
MKRILFGTLITLLIIYVLVCILLFFFQEKLIFFPQKLPKDFKFPFAEEHEELYITTKDNKVLNAVLFKSDHSKGLIFYLHGNAGSIESWGEAAKTYTDLRYDVFMIDYRGFGKSEGSINGQEQLFSDLRIAYDEMKKIYAEKDIIVLGYSLGSGLAARIASENNPKLLILQTPYYSLIDMTRHLYPIIPTFILRYRFETNEYIKHCEMPIVIFHGDQDEVIYYGSSLKLKKIFKETDTLITLKGQTHNGLTDNPEYRDEIKKLLSK